MKKKAFTMRKRLTFLNPDTFNALKAAIGEYCEVGDRMVDYYLSETYENLKPPVKDCLQRFLGIDKSVLEDDAVIFVEGDNQLMVYKPEYAVAKIYA